MKKSRTLLWITFFTLFGIWLGSMFRQPVPERLSKLDQFFSYLENEYVDTLDLDRLVERAIDGILEELDPHSAYIPSSETELMAQRMQGNFQGIGIEFTRFEDTLVVVRTIEGGPAERAGLLAGDRIFAVDRDTLVGANYPADDYTSRIKGPADTPVLLGVSRKGKPFELEVIRGFIPLESVTLTKLEGSIGYIRLERFAETTHEEVRQALDKLSEGGMRALILDLRGNPGGYLHEATAVADEFLGDDKLIVTTRYRDGQESLSVAHSGSPYEELPVHILIDGQSASASEVLTGALQDHDRAVVYGSTSFGKGLVQEDKVLSDGSKVRLTVAYYYTPSGRSIQRPYDGTDLAGQMDGQVFTSDSGRVLSTLGGIEPDVPLEGDSANAYYWSFSFGTLDAYAFQKIDGERDQFSSYDRDAFVDDYAVSDMLLVDFLRYGGYGLALEDLPRGEREDLRRWLKAVLARNLWGYEAYQAVLLDQDRAYRQVKKAALSALN